MGHIAGVVTNGANKRTNEAKQNPRDARSLSCAARGSASETQCGGSLYSTACTVLSGTDGEVRASRGLGCGEGKRPPGFVS